MLADDFFRLCHHDSSGRPLLHPRVAGIGLAAALLGELAFTARIAVEHGCVRVTDRTSPSDAVAHKVLDHLLGEAGVLPIRTWLAFLGCSAYEDVAQRMTRARHLRPEESRRLLRRTVTYVPTDINVAAWPAARLSTRLRHHEPLTDEDVFLAGLTRATDLHLRLLDGAPRAAFEFLTLQVEAAWRGTQELLHHTQAAVGDGVLSAH
ncbi:GOLPH3/VPS74 family protein [Micromonospora endolithica]|uniref:GPP34 family phosphoprotein n=1 Tax=Micromonospora endolithica TaxID=230091 RepID=A0A3A9ZK51_9ACTN|nr:GPP34 family phosphoprotein [Micromonospora endolithica]RKN48673.1 GPP34 family phosphoprotein [Micromonospora endolithica]